MIVNGDGVPVWWFQAKFDPYNVELQPDGTISWDPIDDITLQEGNYEVRSLDRRLLRARQRRRGRARRRPRADPARQRQLPARHPGRLSSRHECLWRLGRLGRPRDRDPGDHAGWRRRLPVAFPRPHRRRGDPAALVGSADPQQRALRHQPLELRRAHRQGRQVHAALLPPPRRRLQDQPGDGQRRLEAGRNRDAEEPRGAQRSARGRHPARRPARRSRPAERDRERSTTTGPRFRSRRGSTATGSTRAPGPQAVQSFEDPEVPVSTCCGSARRLPAGEWLVGWGGSARSEPTNGPASESSSSRSTPTSATGRCRSPTASSPPAGCVARWTRSPTASRRSQARAADAMG